MSQKVHLYTGVHKGQRSSLYKLAIAAGKINNYDEAKLIEFHNELTALRDEFRLHAELEEKFIHPLIRERLPGIAWRKEEEHKVQHRDFDDLVNMSKLMVSKSKNLEMRGEMGLELYRALNRFIALYLVHINEEEEFIQPSLWETCNQMELGGAMRDSILYQKPDELRNHLEMMLSSMNRDEITDLLAAGSKIVQPEALQELYDIGDKVVDPDDWAEVKSRLEKDKS
jgi:DUF438 domain-containing protein